MLPPKMQSAGPAQAALPAKIRLADHILAEGIQQGSFDRNRGSAAPESDPPRSSGTLEFLSRFSPRIKEKTAELALAGFSSDAETLLHAACILSVLSPRPDELDTLAEVFDARDRLAGREILRRLFEAGWMSLAETSAFMSMENRMFPSLPGYEAVAGMAPSDEAPPTKRSVPPSGRIGRNVEMNVAGGYVDAKGNAGYEFTPKKRV